LRIWFCDSAKASQCLRRAQAAWQSIFTLEKLLLPEEVRDSAHVELQLAAASAKHPELTQFYWFLEGVAWQYTRDVVGLLQKSDWNPELLREDTVQCILKDSFAGPSSTKTWTEDCFRDMRYALLKVPDSKVTAWTRQKLAMDSLQGRDLETCHPSFFKVLIEQFFLH
jgi:hypothetical protein